MKQFIQLMLIVFLIGSLEMVDSHPASAGVISSELTVGLNSRTHQLNWNIAGDITGQNPNILSELTWNGVQTSGFQVQSKVVMHEQLFATGSLSYGWIYRGSNQDSDYSGDNRTGEFSRSNNNSDNGNTMDASIALGYGLAQTRLWNISGMFGFSYHIQYLKITDGYQTVPPNGGFTGLDSSYTATWNGLWLGVDAGYSINEKLKLDGNFQYHPVNYNGTGNWNLRADLAHPVSFTHIAGGAGITLATGLNYQFHQQWSTGISVEYGNWSTGPGLDITYGTDGSILGQQQLNQVNWSFLTVTIKAIHRF